MAKTVAKSQKKSAIKKSEIIVKTPEELNLKPIIVSAEPRVAKATNAVGPYDVDLSKGTTLWTVSQEWATRPDDQRFTTYASLREHVLRQHEIASEPLLNSEGLRFLAGDRGELVAEYLGTPYALNNAATTQLCKLLEFSPNSLADLSTETASTVLRELITKHQAGIVKGLARKHPDQEIATLEAITSENYGRIWNKDLIDIIDYILLIEPGFKVPGELDWSTMQHNPNVDVTKDSSSLFAGQRDMFVFLCDDANPIECGKTPSGKPDVYFRGFYLKGTETGFGTQEGASFNLRGVCFNRSLRGVEGIKSFTMRHGKHAQDNFQKHSAIMAKSIKQADATPLVRMIENAKSLKIADNREQCMEFLKKYTNGKEAKEIVLTCEAEEEQEPRTVYLASAAITAYAKTKPNQDARYRLEDIGSTVLELAAA